MNARLPTYTDHIQIEAFRGHGATLGQTVVLPAITSEDATFWPTQPRFQTINELYARNCLRRRPAQASCDLARQSCVACFCSIAGKAKAREAHQHHRPS
jgi:hypothetical protein